MFGRVLRIGLSRLRRLAAPRLAPSGINPSRFGWSSFWDMSIDLALVAALIAIGGVAGARLIG